MRTYDRQLVSGEGVDVTWSSPADLAISMTTSEISVPDGAGAPVDGAVVKQPLTAAPDATTSVVVALTGSPAQDTFSLVQYRLRRRSLTATG